MSDLGRLDLQVAATAAARPDDVAVIEVGPGADRRWTWAELTAATAAQAAALDAEPGEPVAYQLPNRLEFVALTLAILGRGAIAMPLMPVFRERELRFMLAAARARRLYVPSSFRGHDHLAMATALRSELDHLEAVRVLDPSPVAAGAAHGLAPAGGPRDTAAADPDPLAQLLFTSGTSGEPKGVLHRHGTLMRAAARHVRHFGLTAEDVIFSPAPLAHQTGFLYGMWLALGLGATLVIQESWDGARALAAMREHRVSFVQVATPFLADLVALGTPLPDLRIFVATGAAVPRELARRARAVLGAEVGGGFGTTETCMGAAFLPGEDPDRAWSTDGRQMDGLSLRVCDDADAPLPPGTEGHFQIRTDTAFSGYLNRPDLTAEAFTPDGWYRTGDLATVDADGYLKITGRVKDVINRGGEKVPVAEVEQLIYELDEVLEVAIVAMPDPRLTERACAFVTLAPGRELDLEAVLGHLAARRLAKPYWPERLVVLDDLPKTPSGKIKKYELREHAAALVTPLPEPTPRTTA